MRRIIYVDMYFILNFVIPFFLLTLTAFFRQRTSGMKRIICASFFSALLATLIPFLPVKNAVFEKIFVFPEIILLLLLGFRYEGKKVFLKDFFIFFLLLCFSGGCITVLLQFLSFGAYERKYPVLWIFLAVLFLFFSMLFLRMELLMAVQRQKNTYRVRIVFRADDFVVKGLYDTGNQLVSPYTGESVMLISKALAERLQYEREKKQLIPYHSVGGSGLLEAFRVDAIEIMEKGEKRDHVLVAVSDSIDESSEIQIILNLM